VARVRSTPAYLAPEAIFNLPIETKEIIAVDLWALGCLIYELIFGKPLFYKAKGIQQLGSMIFLLFESQFNEVNLSQNVLDNIIRDCPVIEESLREIKHNFTWLENEDHQLWSLINTLLSAKP
jgi:serine/threonine protein kinase